MCLQIKPIVTVHDHVLQTNWHLGETVVFIILIPTLKIADNLFNKLNADINIT